MAQPLMDEFSRDMRQPCHLVIPQHGFGVIIAQASAVSHWEFRARVGATMDLFETGSGLTLLACQHPSRVDEILGQWGVTDAQRRLRAVEPELNSVRQAGYRIEPSHQVVGSTDMSVPVCGPFGDAVAALTCAYMEPPKIPRNRNIDATLDRLIQLSHSLSSDIGDVN
ncbi:hypothetical protein KDD30_19090 (plasmid) [Photobacterium sp. GJ3]|uniref:IclR family transcriptional regulator domain-containing protein n=1 Tax=Photobacterium sp. GJ3 TaxID=2829502 RepID=UPI001B8AB176|nr:IclR family transcriptional regulator C-terminal domain-containing protein [Photobacterium sp. GJ3]QUJ70230.1 hypothetical protein KDD30_19090 [Photobacterium sp. GJ3]